MSEYYKPLAGNPSAVRTADGAWPELTRRCQQFGVNR